VLVEVLAPRRLRGRSKRIQSVSKHLRGDGTVTLRQDSSQRGFSTSLRTLCNHHLQLRGSSKTCNHRRAP